MWSDKPIDHLPLQNKSCFAGEITIIHNKSRKNAVAKNVSSYGTYDLQIGTAVEHRFSSSK
jgi:hypothetical protein